MKFADVVALRPQGTDSASLRAAIAKAEAARTDALDRASSLEAGMSRALLTASDETMEAVERDAATARRGADRIEALIGQMRQMLTEAEQRESAEHQQRLRDAAIAADERFVEVWAKHFASLVEKAAQILVAKREADAAIAQISPAGRLPRSAAFPPVSAGVADRLALVLAVAELAPSEIARRQAEIDAADERDQRRRRIEAAQLAERQRLGRLEVEREDADRERQRRERMVPLGVDRAPVTVNGRPVSVTLGGGW